MKENNSVTVEKEVEKGKTIINVKNIFNGTEELSEIFIDFIMKKAINYAND